MSLIKEKILIKKWAAENKTPTVFPGWDEDAESYFIEAEPIYIMEYGFGTAPELERAFSDVWKENQDDDVKRILVISALKSMLDEGAANLIPTDSKIPQYIYTF